MRYIESIAWHAGGRASYTNLGTKYPRALTVSTATDRPVAAAIRRWRHRKSRDSDARRRCAVAARCCPSALTSLQKNAHYKLHRPAGVYLFISQKCRQKAKIKNIYTLHCLWTSSIALRTNISILLIIYFCYRHVSVLIDTYAGYNWELPKLVSRGTGPNPSYHNVTDHELRVRRIFVSDGALHWGGIKLFRYDTDITSLHRNNVSTRIVMSTMPHPLADGHRGSGRL